MRTGARAGRGSELTPADAVISLPRDALPHGSLEIPDPTAATGNPGLYQCQAAPTLEASDGAGWVFLEAPHLTVKQP